jgi:Cu/Ag efflux protein CusF
MKLSTIAAGVAIALISVPALSQSGDMKMGEMKGIQMDGMSCCDEMAPGFGVVNSVDLDARTVNLSHDPIKKIGWGKMTMDFAVSDMVALQKFQKGDNVHFMLELMRQIRAAIEAGRFAAFREQFHRRFRITDQAKRHEQRALRQAKREQL